MADIQQGVCAFCKKGEEAGILLNTSDDHILAHVNCLGVPGPSNTEHDHRGFFIRSDSETDGEPDGFQSAQIGIEQNAPLRAGSEGRLPTDHTYHASMEVTGSVLHQQTFVVRSDTESEDELPVFNGSQLVNIKGEGNSTNENTSVAGTPSGFLKILLPSLSCERTPSSICSSPVIPEQHCAVSPNSLLMSQDNITEDYDVHQTGQDNRSDRSNTDIAASESLLKRTLEGQSTSSSYVPDAARISTQPRHDPGVRSSSLGQPIDDGKKVNYSVNFQNNMSNQTADFTGGENNGQHKHISNDKGRVKESTGTVTHNPTNTSSISTTKSSEKGPLVESLIIMSALRKKHQNKAKNKEVEFPGSIRKVKKTAARRLLTYSPSTSKEISSSFHKKPLSSTNTIKGSDGQPLDLCSKTLDLPVDTSLKNLNTYGHSREHPSAPAGTGQALPCSSYVKNKSNLKAAWCPIILKKSSTARGRDTQSSSDIRDAKTGKLENKTCHIAQHQIKILSNELKQGVHQLKFNKIFSQINLGTPQSKSQIRNDNVVSTQSPEPGVVSQQPQRNSDDEDNIPRDSGDVISEQPSEDRIVSQPTQNYVSNVDEDPKNADIMDTGQSEDEAASPNAFLEDEPMCLEEEIPRTDEGAVPCSDTTNAAVLTAKYSQTEISSGFPAANIDKPMNLDQDQKSRLMKSYEETEYQMSRTGNMGAGAAKAFWDLCAEYKSRELLLTLTSCCMKSLLHKIVCEQPEERDFQQAFAFLQASGCFADFMNRTEDCQTMIASRIGYEEPCDKVNSNSARCCTEEKGQGELAIDEDPDEMDTSSPGTSSASNLVKQKQGTREEGQSKAETEKMSSLAAKEFPGTEDHDGMQSELDKLSDNVVRTELSNLSSETNRKEKSSREDNVNQIELTRLCSESNRVEESSKDDNVTKPELSKQSSESSRNGNSSKEDNVRKPELSTLSSESSRKWNSSKEDNVRKPELSTLSSESSRKGNSSKEDNIRNPELSTLFSKSSRKGNSSKEDNIRKPELSLPPSESSRNSEIPRYEDQDYNGVPHEFSETSSSSSRQSLIEDTSRGQLTSEEFQVMITATLQVLQAQQKTIIDKLQQLTEDGDTCFALSLVQHLRKVPESKKLSTKFAILSAVLNLSSPNLSRQTPQPEP